MRSFQIDEIPAAFGFREWMQRIYVKATAASRRSNVRTPQWLQRIETAPSLAELEYLDGRWEDLVAALAEAVMTVAKGPLKRELRLYAEERTRIGQLLAGRAALWHVYQRFKLERGIAMGIDISMLLQLTFDGDLEGFLPAWDHPHGAQKAAG